LQTRPDPDPENEEKHKESWISSGNPTRRRTSDQIVRAGCFRNGDRKNASWIVDESCRAQGEGEGWQAEMYELLGKSERRKEILRKMADQGSPGTWIAGWC